MKEKGQVSFEFIITILFILFIFGFSLFIFQSRIQFNNNSFVSWEASQVADKIARNVNLIALMDNNSELIDYIYWDFSNQSITFSKRTVQVNYVGGGFVDAILFYDVNNLVTNFNGEIIFEKKNDQVVIRNA